MRVPEAAAAALRLLLGSVMGVSAHTRARFEHAAPDVAVLRRVDHACGGGGDGGLWVVDGLVCCYSFVALARVRGLCVRCSVTVADATVA